jgi:hypothetical protein
MWAGCTRPSVTIKPPVSTGPGVPMLTRDDVQPDADPPPKAKLLYLGTTVPVTVKAERKGDIFTINLLAHGDLFDSEEYVKTLDGLALSNAAGEVYSPPIPLLKFPLAVGDEPMTWVGTLSGELDPHRASAKISSSKESVTLGQTSAETIRVQVDILLESISEGESAERRLVFWFLPKKGVVKRQFGTTSTREPVEG